MCWIFSFKTPSFGVLKIIGEAARRISEATRLSLPQIKWSQMIAMRNLMIHEYDDVSPEIVWQTVQHDLPLLITVLAPLFSNDA